MPLHLTASEMCLVDTRRTGTTPLDILAEINKGRKKRKEPDLAANAVYRYLKGGTHVRGRTETRGRKEVLSNQDKLRLNQTRRRLVKKAKNEKRVIWDDVIAAANLPKKVHKKTVASKLNERFKITYKPARAKVPISEEDAKKRKKIAKQWALRPASFWSTKVHCYYDNKAFPMPLSPKQRARFRQTRVVGHLRAASEGLDQGFTKPRQKHSFIGVPSVTISAAVAKDRVIMWHVVEGSWNGQAAADVYQGEMIKALRRTWGARRKFTIVEDGDKKGNQSGKGLRAKEAAGIEAMVLPPRTPNWMPLDYSIWDKIVQTLDETAPAGHESKKDFLARLKRTAKTLPKGYVKKTIGKMRQRILDVVEAKGWHPKSD